MFAARREWVNKPLRSKAHSFPVLHIYKLRPQRQFCISFPFLFYAEMTLWFFAIPLDFAFFFPLRSLCVSLCVSVRVSVCWCFHNVFNKVRGKALVKPVTQSVSKFFCLQLLPLLPQRKGNWEEERRREKKRGEWVALIFVLPLSHCCPPVPYCPFGPFIHTQKKSRMPSQDSVYTVHLIHSGEFIRCICYTTKCCRRCIFNLKKFHGQLLKLCFQKFCHRRNVLFAFAEQTQCPWEGKEDTEHWSTGRTVRKL